MGKPSIIITKIPVNDLRNALILLKNISRLLAEKGINIKPNERLRRIYKRICAYESNHFIDKTSSVISNSPIKKYLSCQRLGNLVTRRDWDSAINGSLELQQGKNKDCPIRYYIHSKETVDQSKNAYQKINHRKSSLAWESFKIKKGETIARLNSILLFMYLFLYHMMHRSHLKEEMHHYEKSVNNEHPAFFSVNLRIVSYRKSLKQTISEAFLMNHSANQSVSKITDSIMGSYNRRLRLILCSIQGNSLSSSFRLIDSTTIKQKNVNIPIPSFPSIL